MSGSWLDSLGGIMPGTTGQLDPSSTANPAGYAGLSLGTGTGQYGTIPMQTPIGAGGVSGAVQEFKDWIDTPIKSPLSLTGLFILVGTVLVAVIAWNFVIFHVRIAAETI